MLEISAVGQDKMLLQIRDKNLAEALSAVCGIAHRDGGFALVVGGSVRDSLLGLPVGDIDVEVYGVSPETLKVRLAQHFRIDLVGAAFGIIKLHGLPMDISIPRKESKAGLGHKGFQVLSDPDMTVEEALSRRDFTINAMAYDPITGELHDYFSGEADLRKRVLRHTSDKFVEDPLRVLRGMQFAARFRLRATQETLRLCASIEKEELAKERIFEEWKKLLLKGVKISMGLEFLRESEWIRYFPELQALIGCRQDAVGDMWEHTLFCMDAFADARTGDECEDLIVGLAVLCHLFGKPVTTGDGEERIRSFSHSDAGETLTRSFLSAMTDQSDLIDAVVPLVKEHLRPEELYEAKASPATIRKLACRVGRIDRLVRVAHADSSGRLGRCLAPFPAGEWLVRNAKALNVYDSVPSPIVMGRHLIDLGIQPGPSFKPILDACYEAQIEGEITSLEEGVAMAKKIAHKNLNPA